MRLSVIIPTINERANIVSAIDSAWGAGAAEVIVVDGGSSDGTAELAQANRGCVVRTQPGRAVQMNEGARRAQGDLLLFLHADCRLTEGVGVQLAAATENPAVAWGAFWQRIDAAGAAYRFLELGNALRVRWRGMPLGDQAVFVRRDYFRRLGKFSLVPLLEDADFAARARGVSPPALLPGPVIVSARRWKEAGIIRQTLRNWRILYGWRRGRSIDDLARSYRRHDQCDASGGAREMDSTVTGHRDSDRGPLRP
ncbi:MAG: glycosyltransferase [Planctomycetes bacterium]|nr:glycosyltransferase [Planctomycetota bacterium]